MVQFISGVPIYCFFVSVVSDLSDGRRRYSLFHSIRVHSQGGCVRLLNAFRSLHICGVYYEEQFFVQPSSVDGTFQWNKGSVRLLPFGSVDNPVRLVQCPKRSEVHRVLFWTTFFVNIVSLVTSSSCVFGRMSKRRWWTRMTSTRICNHQTLHSGGLLRHSSTKRWFSVGLCTVIPFLPYHCALIQLIRLFVLAGALRRLLEMTRSEFSSDTASTLLGLKNAPGWRFD